VSVRSCIHLSINNKDESAYYIISLAYLYISARVLEPVVLGWYPRNLDIVVGDLENLI
jgi:hypothetical protein